MNKTQGNEPRLPATIIRGSEGIYQSVYAADSRWFVGYDYVSCKGFDGKDVKNAGHYATCNTKEEALSKLGELKSELYPPCELCGLDGDLDENNICANCEALNEPTGEGK